MATNLSTKGQVTTPKKVRDYLGLKAGATVRMNTEYILALTRAD